jgi:hypothetical protein
MTTCITTTNTTDRDNAEDKIWYNYIMNVANNDKKLVGDGTNHYFLSELQAMTEAQVIALKVYGKKEGVIQTTEGFTTEYLEFRECNDTPGKYWAYKPSASLMSGVVNMTEEPFDSNWSPPSEI